jgi:Zn-finger nucleic acid-binding protein
MICPKCRSQMQTFNRQGLNIEQCPGCGGIFLDRGELEQIVHAEQQHYGISQPGGYADSPRPYQAHRDSPPPYAPQGGRYSDSPPPYGGRRRKRSFLEDLFD